MQPIHILPRRPLRRTLLSALVAAGAAACAPAQPSPPALDTVPAPRTPTPPAMTPPGSDRGVGAVEAGPVRLELVSRRAVANPEPRALGLTGANKPNDLAQRLREASPPNTPRWLPRTQNGLQRFIADSTADGWLGFYRGPLELQPGSRNARFRALLYGADDAIWWDLELNRFLSRPDHLEIQDVRLDGGKLYFNEACQSYSREAGGRCSSLVRVDPRAGRVEWRSPPLVSNNVFLPHGQHVITGYGFTAEPDSVFVLDRATGRVLARAALDSAHRYLEVKNGELWVLTQGSVYRFRIRG